MEVQINDCTIRDGGYLLGKDSPPEFVTHVFSGLLSAGIDVIEIGFLQDNVNGESIVYHDSVEAAKLVPAGASGSRFTGFCDNSRYSIESLDECSSEGAFEYLKISFAKHESDEALAFVREAKEKGYKVFANPMDAPSYSDEERADMIDAINEIEPYCFSIVDTFGSMYLDDLREIFCQIDKHLDSSIRIGLHSHNNLQLSSALAEYMIDLASETDRDIVVDASLYGMGRGAGNASTEAIAAYLNKKFGYSYDIGILLDTIEYLIAPLGKDVTWGYDLPMFTCGMLGAHVDNVFHLAERQCSARGLLNILGSLNPSQRKRYGKGYSKTDFSLLDAKFASCQVGEVR